MWQSAIGLFCLFQIASAKAKISHRVHVVRPVTCAPAERARRGDEVVLSLAAMNSASVAMEASEGMAEQQHVVGKHPVTPLNKALVGMCVGERRKVSVFWDGNPGVQYVVDLRDIKTRQKIKEL